MNLVVDDGNSLTKVGIFDHDRLVARHSFSHWHELEGLVSEKSFDGAIVCSVKGIEEQIAKVIKTDHTFFMNHELPLPISNKYETPHTLGMDRLAGVCGGVELFPNNNTLIIDAGTCVTFDLVDSYRTYRGGSIGPGLNMRAEAVNKFTAKLPLVHLESRPPLIGASTESCIQSGVANGMIAELDGLITRYQEQFSDLKIVMCGGDTAFFENQLKASIFACPELVLLGLNSILRYNVNS